MIDSIPEWEQQILWFWLISVGRGPLQDLLFLIPRWLHWKTFTSHTSSHWYLKMQRQEFYCANSVCPVPHHQLVEMLFVMTFQTFLGSWAPVRWKGADAFTFCGVPFRLFPH